MSPPRRLGFPEASDPDLAHEAGWVRRRISPVFGQHAAVATGHPLATSVGLQVLRDGGNAVDAAVAAGLTSAAVLPEMCGLGGDLFAIVHRPASGSRPAQTLSCQGSGAAPMRSTREMMYAAGDGTSMPARGPLSVAVPGMVHAYGTLLDRFGSRTFAELVEPAIDYAEAHPVSAVGVSYVERFAELLGTYPAAREVFLPQGKPPGPGDIRRQPDLARTLRALADGGVEEFYRGQIAERIAAAVQAAGGALSMADLAAQETTITEPISTTYRGYTVHQTRLPSQGMVVLEALNVAEQFDLANASASQRAHVLIEASKLAFADRVGHCADPALHDAPVELLLSKQWAARRARQVGSQASTDVVPGELRSGDTSYLCAVDGSGMMVSLIQSVAANFGSGLVADGTGVVLNNRASQFSLDHRHPNVFAPGKKTVHTLNCYLVDDPAGWPVLVGGTPGGDRQPPWNLQILTGLIDGGWDVQQAIEQPLWVLAPKPGEHDGAPFRVDIEDRADETTTRELSGRGHRLGRLAPWGCESVVQLIARDPDAGVLAAGSDPRGEGQAQAW